VIAYTTTQSVSPISRSQLQRPRAAGIEALVLQTPSDLRPETDDNQSAASHVYT